MNAFDGVKVFSATKMKDRELLGDLVNEWLVHNLPYFEVVDCEVRQSSDNEFHCLSIVLFYKKK